MAMADAGHHVDIVTRRIVDPDWPEFADAVDGYDGYGKRLRILRLLSSGKVHPTPATPFVAA